MKILLFLLTASFAFAADYYPATSRFGYFDPNVLQGVVGGIPSRSGGNVINAADYGFSEVASGATNATAIEDAALAASPGDIVSLPAGTFSVAQVDLNENHSGITIRGAGMGSTILNATASYGFNVGRGTNYGSVFNASSTVSSITEGSNSVVLSDGSSFPSPNAEANYKIARLQLVNEAVTPVVSTGNTPKVRTITVLVTARSGNTLTLSQPLPSSFANGSSGATFELCEQNALNWTTYGLGIEDLTIDGNGSSALDNGILFTQSTGCWIKGVKVIGHDNYGIQVIDSINFEMRKSYIGAALSGGSNRAGLLWNYSTYGLVEDNIIVENDPQIEVNFGSTSNIFSYNFLGTGKLNCNHGPHNSYNLFEGNSYWYIQSDGYFGGSSQETDFRNWMRSGVAVVQKRLTRERNIIGNIVGTAGETYAKDYSDEWGLPNINNLSSNGTWQLSDSSYSVDWDSANSRPYYWTGILTTRTSDRIGVITLDSGMITSFNTAIANAANNERAISLADFADQETVTITGVSGSDVTFQLNDAAGNLPATSTVMWFAPGVSGFQEKDLDVAATTIRKANYYVLTGDIPAGESLGGDTLPNSYYLDSKPSWFGNLAWPAYDSSSPPASEADALVAIPAGYRYVNGNENYLGASGGVTINGTLTVTGTITLE